MIDWRTSSLVYAICIIQKLNISLLQLMLHILHACTICCVFQEHIRITQFVKFSDVIRRIVIKLKPVCMLTNFITMTPIPCVWVLLLLVLQSCPVSACLIPVTELNDYLIYCSVEFRVPQFHSLSKAILESLCHPMIRKPVEVTHCKVIPCNG